LCFYFLKNTQKNLQKGLTRIRARGVCFSFLIFFIFFKGGCSPCWMWVTEDQLGVKAGELGVKAGELGVKAGELGVKAGELGKNIDLLLFYI